MKATGKPHALSRRKTLDVVALAKRALVRDDVVLGAVAGGDVVLGNHGDQIGASLDLEDFFGLALDHERAERLFGGWAIRYLNVHGKVPNPFVGNEQVYTKLGGDKKRNLRLWVIFKPGQTA